jgi:hypothetical protein
LYHLGIGLIWVLAGQKISLKVLSFRENLFISIITALLCSFSGLLIYWLWPYMKLDALDLGAELTALGLSGVSWLIFILYYFSVNPWFEEFFWRSYLNSNTKKLTAPDIWFAGYHLLVLVKFIKLPWVILSFFVLIGTAWFWRYLTNKYQNLSIALASHLAADLSIIGAIYWLSQ